MSNLSKIMSLFKSLLPEIEVFQRPDKNLKNFFKVLCLEFSRFLDLLDSLSSALPDSQDSLLAERWSQIFGGGLKELC